MRQNITTILKNGSLTPKQRALLIIHNGIELERTGKESLTPADIKAIRDDWKPKDNEEVAIFNKYINAWRSVGFAELDAQTTYLSTENDFLRVMRAIDAFKYQSAIKFKNPKIETHFIDSLKSIGKLYDEKEARELIIKNSGLKLDKVAYQFAFDLMDNELKEDLIKLYADIKSEQAYLRAEELLAEELEGNKEPSQKGKERIANAMAYEAYNRYSKKWNFEDYFASIPIRGLLHKWAEYNKIDYSQEVREIERNLEEKGKEKVIDLIDKELGRKSTEQEYKQAVDNNAVKEALKHYAEAHNKEIGEILKETALKWIDGGLFNEHTPLFLSEDKNTYGGDTKLVHKEIFKQWLKWKQEAEQKVKELIDKDELKIAKREETFLNHKTTIELITGESLYNCKRDYKFIEDYKKQVEDFTSLGLLILFLKDTHFLKSYAELLAFLDIFERLSKVFDIDLSYKIVKWIDDFKEYWRELELSLNNIRDGVGFETYKNNDCSHLLELITTDLFIKPENIKPDTEGRIKTYYNEFDKALGNSWRAEK